MTTAESFRVGEWRIEPSTCCINRGGTARKLEPKVMDLLVYMASRPGEVIPREELEAHVWAGMVVGYDALTQAIIKLRKALEDDPKHPRFIETIPKKGYRLNMEIAALPDAVNAASTDKSCDERAFETTAVTEPRSRRRWLALGAIASVLVLGALAWQSFQPKIPAGPVQTADKPSIAVLPFTNVSDDPAQEYFSDGISEDIITDLSRLANLVVIARNSSFTYKGSPVNVQQVGQDLGVRYVLEGSVRKVGDSVRITAQLVDTSSGHHLWAERYDRKLTDIFELQDDITLHIIKALAIHLREDEGRDLERAATRNFEAYDLFLKGQQISAEFTEQALFRAVELYRQAIRLDPGYAHAYGALGVARIRQFFLGYSDSPARTKDRALELAREAESLDPTSHQIQWSLGYIYMYRKQFDEAERAAMRAVSFSPNYADGYALLALIKNNMGQADEAIALLGKAMALNPYYTWDYVYQLGRAYYVKGEYDKAATYLHDAIERNPSVGIPRLFLAATYVNLGDTEDAQWEVTEIQVSHPEYTLSYLQKMIPIVNQKLRDRFFVDLRAAGLSD